MASGKGGTGKTTVAVNLALSLRNVQLLDCDVEEPNAHIFLNPKIEEINLAHTFIPKINYDSCDYCSVRRAVRYMRLLGAILPTDVSNTLRFITIFMTPIYIVKT